VEDEHDLLEKAAIPVQAMTIKEARLATVLLGLHVDVAAHLNAKANGVISPEQADMTINGIKTNYSILLSELTGDTDNDTGDTTQQS